MAKDLYHNEVKIALERDGWTITDDPYYLVAKPHTLKIDLAAERIISAEKIENGVIEKIAVEIKTFGKESFIYEFYEVLGQYLTYEEFLHDQEAERVLYLAINEPIYKVRFLRDESVLRMCQKMKVKFIVFNAHSKIIKEWKK